jgi:hypothetical protein
MHGLPDPKTRIVLTDDNRHDHLPTGYVERLAERVADELRRRQDL